jgi:hypothetical protein
VTVAAATSRGKGLHVDFRRIGTAVTVGWGKKRGGLVCATRGAETVGELSRECRATLRTLVLVANIRFIIPECCPWGALRETREHIPWSFGDDAVHSVRALSLTMHDGADPDSIFSLPHCYSTASNLLRVHLVFWLSAVSAKTEAQARVAML